MLLIMKPKFIIIKQAKTTKFQFMKLKDKIEKLIKKEKRDKKLTDEELQKRQREFEKEALPHMLLLYNYAYRMTGNEEDAKDLVQETYLKAFRFWDQYEPGTNIRAWLFKIMKNSYINKYRKATKEPGKVDYDEVQNFYETVRDESFESSDLQEHIFENIFEDEIIEALGKLPDEFRTVVILADIEGLSYEEIADFLDIPIGTVRSRLHRGRKMLRKQLYEFAKRKGYIKGSPEDYEIDEPDKD